jgi:RNA polymerase primary sigma factor
MQKKVTNDQVQGLITIGKEKGYLTYDEVNDSLPTEVINSDRIDEIVILFGDENIELIGSSEEERFRQEKAQAGKTKSGKAAGDGGIDLTPGTIGKTDDPVRMYLREMGTVPLLTREGEVEIAKRIEAGRKVVLEVISRMPFVVEDMLGWIPKLEESQVRLRDMLILDPYEDETEKLDAIEDSQKRRVIQRLKEIEKLNRKAKQLDAKIRGRKVTGDARKRAIANLEKTQEELCGSVRNLRLNVAQADKYCHQLKSAAQQMWRAEQDAETPCRRLKLELPRFKELVKRAKSNKRSKVSNGKGRSISREALLGADKDSREAHGRIRAVEEQVGLKKDESLRQTKIMRRGEGPGKERARRGEPASGCLHRQEVHQPGSALSGSHPGGKHRPHEGRRQVRVPPGLQILYIRNLVDSPGRDAGHSRSGKDNPHSCSHDRDHQQADPDLPPARPGIWPRAHAGGNRPEDGNAHRESAQSSQDCQGADFPRNPDRGGRGQPPWGFH